MGSGTTDTPGHPKAGLEALGTDRASGRGIDRRTFLVSGTFALAALGGTRALIVPAEASDAETFRTLSAFLTETPYLDPALAARAFGQLTELDPAFPEKVGRLSEVVTSSLAPSMDDFLAHPASSGSAIRETMVTIVSAWTLGYTGTPVPLRAEDDTRFVTFTGALMYRPTMDATVRPTYARDGLNYWVEPPPFVTPPPMPANIRAWGQESPQGIGAIPQPTLEPETPGPDAPAPDTPSATEP